MKMCKVHVILVSQQFLFWENTILVLVKAIRRWKTEIVSFILITLLYLTKNTLFLWHKPWKLLFLEAKKTSSLVIFHYLSLSDFSSEVVSQKAMLLSLLLTKTLRPLKLFLFKAESTLHRLFSFWQILWFNYMAERIMNSEKTNLSISFVLLLRDRWSFLLMKSWKLCCPTE